jgi:hypothetical protein
MIRESAIDHEGAKSFFRFFWKPFPRLSFWVFKQQGIPPLWISQVNLPSVGKARRTADSVGLT